MQNWVLQKKILAQLLNNLHYLGDPLLKSIDAEGDNQGYKYITLKSMLAGDVFYEVVGAILGVKKDGEIIFKDITVNCALRNDDGEFQKVCLIENDVMYELTALTYQELVATMVVIVNRYARESANKKLNKELASTEVDSSFISELKHTINDKLEMGNEQSQSFDPSELLKLELEFEDTIGKPLSELDQWNEYPTDDWH